VRALDKTVILPDDGPLYNFEPDLNDDCASISESTVLVLPHQPARIETNTSATKPGSGLHKPASLNNRSELTRPADFRPAVRSTCAGNKGFRSLHAESTRRLARRKALCRGEKRHRAAVAVASQSERHRVLCPQVDRSTPPDHPDNRSEQRCR
jgi:hypothetical protein